MTTGWRLSVGSRNCSASSRRVSDLAVFADPFWGLPTERDRDFLWNDGPIMPPKEPLAPRTTVHGSRAFLESMGLRHGRMFPRRATPATTRPAKDRRQCGLRERRLRWRAWQLRA